MIKEKNSPKFKNLVETFLGPNHWSKHSTHVHCRATLHVQSRVLVVWILEVFGFLRSVVQDEFRHPPVEQSLLLVVALHLLQSAVFHLGVLQEERWTRAQSHVRKRCYFVVYHSTVLSSTHRHQNAVEILLIVLVLVAVCGGAQQLLEPTQPPHPQDGEVVLAEEGLQQREVDLQSHVVLVVSCQEAKDGAVRITAWETRGEHDHLRSHLMWSEL